MLFFKRKTISVQKLFDIRKFVSNGLMVGKEVLVFFDVKPSNVSVLSHDTMEAKIHHLEMVISAVPELEIFCTDSAECFDENKGYIKARIEKESNSKIITLLERDFEFLDKIDSVTASSRQFVFIYRCKNTKESQVAQEANNIEKIIADQHFEVKRMSQSEIKRFLGIYFGAGVNCDTLPNVDGAQYIE